MELQFFNGIASFAIVLVYASRKPCIIRLCLFSHIEFEPWDASSHSLNLPFVYKRPAIGDLAPQPLPPICLATPPLMPPIRLRSSSSVYGLGMGLS